MVTVHEAELLELAELTAVTLTEAAGAFEGAV